jgi:hypothetical protein
LPSSKRLLLLKEEKMKKIRALTFVLGTVALLAGCGGGGGDSVGVTVSTAAFPVQAGYTARTVAGATDNFTISGTCTGTATLTSSASTASTFESVAGFSTTETLTAQFTNCTPASQASISTSYFDSVYTPIGSSTVGTEYAVLLTAATPIPVSVHVGDTAIYATLTTYTDSTKTVTTGQRVLSYVIEADTASTAIVNVIAKGYNATGQLLFTEQTRYRIALNGTLTIVTIDVQHSTTSTSHFVYTKT